MSSPGTRTSPAARTLLAGISGLWGRIPLKLCLATVLLCGWLQEWYPFSHFPMYSSLGDRTRYFYVTDEGDRPIPLADAFGVRAAFFKKLMEERQRSLWDEASRRLGSEADEEAWLEVEREAGEWALEYIRERADAEMTGAERLILWRVDIALVEGELERGIRRIAEIDAHEPAV